MASERQISFLNDLVEREIKAGPVELLEVAKLVKDKAQEFDSRQASAVIDYLLSLGKLRLALDSVG